MPFRTKVPKNTFCLMDRMLTLAATALRDPSQKN
jgi:hypothetical protein